MNYTIEELSILRESLNHIVIKGTQAQQIANLQIKLETNISDLNKEKTPTKRTTSK